MLNTAGLAERYSRPPTLRSPTLGISAVQPVFLQGPNGAGLSTLFRLLTGLTAADEAEVRDKCGKGT